MTPALVFDVAVLIPRIQSLDPLRRCDAAGTDGRRAFSGRQQHPYPGPSAPGRAARDNRDWISRDRNGGLADHPQRLHRAVKASFLTAMFGFIVSSALARSSPSGRRQAVRRRRRPGTARIVERTLAISQLPRCATLRDDGLGHRLTGRSAAPDRLRADAVAGDQRSLRLAAVGYDEERR